MMESETVLTNGTLVDGTGRRARRAGVLVRGGKIAEIGNFDPSTSWEVVDCTGLHIAPGFIDVHSHSDLEVLRHLQNKVLQGITTEIVGNCGYSPFPMESDTGGIVVMEGIFDGELREAMPSSADYFSLLEKRGTLLNVAALTGHGALRMGVMKTRGEASVEDVRKMERVLEDSLSAGSIGLSTGLNLMPGSFADLEELIRLCKVVRKYRAFYTTHMRDYKFKVVEAVNEALEVARAADVPVQISHMQIVGKKSWDRLDIALERIDRGHREGLDVALDAYPYLAGSCSLTQFLPQWCQEGGIEKLLGRLASRSDYEKIAVQTDQQMSNTWEDLIIYNVRTEANQGLLGKSIARIAKERGKLAPETALDLLREENGYVHLISFNNNEENLRKVLTHPLTMVGTDGHVKQRMSHPRTFGTYPKFLGEYVREKRWMALDEAIVKTSALPARRFGLKGRGTIEVGCVADIVVFDAAVIGSPSDYLSPCHDPEGIRHVLVNGQFVVRDGNLTRLQPGRVLRHSA